MPPGLLLFQFLIGVWYIHYLVLGRYLNVTYRIRAPNALALRTSGILVQLAFTVRILSKNTFSSINSP